MIIFPSSKKMERLVSGICTLSKHRRGVWRRKNIGRRLSWEAELSREKCPAALSIAKGEIIMELNNCWEDRSSYRPQEAKTINASF